MQGITYRHDKDIPIEQLVSLFESIGWKRDSSKWPGVLAEVKFIITAWDGDTLVGLAHLWTNGVMAMIYDVGVHPEYQGRGIGSEMMNYLIFSIQDKKLASLGLFAWEENPQNIPFYEKFGFRKTCGMELLALMHPE